MDAAVLYAATDVRAPQHEAANRLLLRWEGELVVSAFIAAEADHLVLGRLGIDAELSLLEGLAEAVLVESLDRAGLRTARELCERYRGLELGLADASMVVLAERWNTRSLATFDERDFRAVEPLQGGSFELLPADAD